MGGEEFVIHIDAGLTSVVNIAEYLVSQMATLEIQALPNTQITLSFGVANIAEDVSLNQLFERAVQALPVSSKIGWKKRCSPSITLTARRRPLRPKSPGLTLLEPESGHNYHFPASAKCRLI